MIRIPLAVWALTVVTKAQGSANELSVESLIQESKQRLFKQINLGARKLEEATQSSVTLEEGVDKDSIHKNEDCNSDRGCFDPESGPF
jgi:hypothetical protein